MSKRKALTLDERHRALTLMENGKSIRAVAVEMGVGKTQVADLLKRKREILTDIENNAPGERKRKRFKSGNEDINELTWKWFQEAVTRRINVTGPMIKERALQFATELKNDTFKASNGWLSSFLKRHNIVFGKMSGERGDVDDNVVDDWIERLPSICTGYDPKDIFNMDETGLLFRDTTRYTFHLKGDDCAGGKRSKERITLALCASLEGEKLTPLVIGKSKKPRCFNSINPDTLPVIYRNNAKAWMTSSLFEEWIRTVDRKMKRQNRKILLFVDNAPCHPKIDLPNVKLQFFPPNVTSKAQPMDQGIIQTLKLKFRKRQLQHFIREVDNSTKSGSDILKEISLLDAIYWVKGSWSEVNDSTIQKCFEKAGFSAGSLSNDTCNDTDGDCTDCDDDDDVPLRYVQLSKELFGCSFTDLCKIDEIVKTCSDEMTDWNKSAQEILNDIREEGSDSNADENACDANENTHSVISLSQFQSYLSKMKDYAIHHGKATLLSSVMDIDNMIGTELVSNSTKQATIRDFFK